MNINDMSSTLWSRLSQLAKAKYDIVLTQEAEVNNPKIHRKVNHARQFKASGVAYTNLGSKVRSGGTSIPLSADAA